MSEQPQSLEAFYAANEDRRSSAEFEFGDSWTDAAGNEYELSWIESTGEMYLMLGPDAVVGVDAFGDFWVGQSAEGLSVVVIGSCATHDEVIVTLEGWESAVQGENSLEWLRSRLNNR